MSKFEVGDQAKYCDRIGDVVATHKDVAWMWFEDRGVGVPIPIKHLKPIPIPTEPPCPLRYVNKNLWSQSNNVPGTYPERFAVAFTLQHAIENQLIDVFWEDDAVGYKTYGTEHHNPTGEFYDVLEAVSYIWPSVFGHLIEKEGA